MELCDQHYSLLHCGPSFSTALAMHPNITFLVEQRLPQTLLVTPCAGCQDDLSTGLIGAPPMPARGMGPRPCTVPGGHRTLGRCTPGLTALVGRRFCRDDQ